MSEPVSIQIRVRVARTRSGRKPTKAVIDEAVKVWAETGEAPRGFEISSVTWHNYKRKVPERTASNEEAIELARESLHLSEALSSPLAKHVTISQVGKGQGKSAS